jgi:repressor LexA
VIDNFNSGVGKKIYRLRKRKKMTRAKLGEIVGLHESTIKRYEDGDIKNLSIDNLKVFAEALDVEPAYLMGIQELEKTSTNNIVKVYGRICAGDGILAFEDILDEIICPYPRITGDLIALQVDGESMNKIIPHGVYSIIKIQPNCENGQICAVIINGEDAMLKRVYRLDEDTLILKPESTEDYRPITFIGEEINKIKIVGKYIGYVTPYVE